MNPGRIGLFAAAVALFALAAPNAESAMPKLNIGAASNTASMMVFVGVDKGIFVKHGIDAKVIVRNTGSQLTKSLKAGQIDFGPAAFSNLPVALERGIQLRGIVGVIGRSYVEPTGDAFFGIAIHPKSGVKSLSDLQGKKVGVRFGSTADLYLRVLLQKTGIGVNKIKRINVRPPSFVSLFDTGAVQVMVAWEPYLTRMTDKVKGSKLLIRGGGYVCFCAGLHGTPEKVYRDKAVTQALVNGISEAAAYVRDPKNLDEISKIAARYIQGMDAALIKRVIKYADYDPRLGKNTFKAFNASVKQLIAQKKMKKPFPPEKYFDLQFINRTMKEHPEWFKDLPPAS